MPLQLRFDDQLKRLPNQKKKLDHIEHVYDSFKEQCKVSTAGNRKKGLKKF